MKKTSMYSLILLSVCFITSIFSMQTMTVQKIDEKGVFLFGLDHSFQRDRDIPRYELFKKLIQEVDAEAMRAGNTETPLYIFVEHARSLYEPFLKGRIHPSIERGLLNYTAKTPFKLSQVIDCEIRKVSGAAFDLFTHCDSHKLSTLAKNCKLFDSQFEEQFKSYSCDLEQVTFQDLCLEFESLEREMTNFRNSWPDKKIKEEFDRSLGQARSSFDLIHKFIIQKQILHKKMFDFAKELCELQDFESMEYLNDAVRAAFARLR